MAQGSSPCTAAARAAACRSPSQSPVIFCSWCRPGSLLSHSCQRNALQHSKFSTHLRSGALGGRDLLRGLGGASLQPSLHTSPPAASPGWRSQHALCRETLPACSWVDGVHQRGPLQGPVDGPPTGRTKEVGGVGHHGYSALEPAVCFSVCGHSQRAWKPQQDGLEWRGPGSCFTAVSSLCIFPSFLPSFCHWPLALSSLTAQGPRPSAAYWV